MKKNNKGFSLVELIVVIAIMAILAAVAIPTFAHFITKANEASDAELLNNINYIFNAACVENGVDVKDVTSATWDMDTMLVTSAKVNGDENADIVASFATHFDLTEEEFILIEDIVFDPAKHEFVAGTVLGITGSNGNTYYYVADPEKVNALQNSIFMSDKMGAEDTLAIMDKVGAFAQDFLLDNDSESLNQVMQSVEFVQAFARYVSYPETVSDADDVSAFYLWMEEQYEEDERAKVTSNALMLFSSEKSGSLTNQSVKDLLGGNGEFTAKEQILANLGGENPDTATAMAQTAAAYSLYTAYLHSLPDDYVDETSNKTKAELITAATVDPIAVLNGLDDDGFQQYINDPANSKDIDGYLAAMGMMNEASGTSNGNGGTAAGDILNEGFNTDWMQGMLNQATGN